MEFDVFNFAIQIASSPYGLPAFLFVVVWFLGAIIRERLKETDKQLDTLIKILNTEMDKAKEREQWYQNYSSKLVEVFQSRIIDMNNDIKDIWQVVKKGGEIFEQQRKDSEDKISSLPCCSSSDDGFFRWLARDDDGKGGEKQ